MFSNLGLYKNDEDDILKQKNFLNNLDAESLYELFKFISIDNIVLLDNTHLYQLIKHWDIKVKTIELASKYLDVITAFNHFISNMSGETFLKYLDQYMLEQIVKSDKKISIIKALLFSGNPNIINNLNESPLMQYLVDNFLTFYRLLGPLPDDIVVVLFQYIEHKRPDKLNLIVELYEKNQFTAIKYLGRYKFYNVILKNDLFKYLDNQIITLLIEQEPFYTYFAELPIEVIVSLIKNGVILPANLSRNRVFIEKMMTIKEPNIYRFIINRIIDNSYNNYQRYKWRRLNNCLEYLKENNRLFKMEDLNNVKISCDILPLRFFYELFTDEYIEKEREIYYDYQVGLINSCKCLLPEFYDFYRNPCMEQLKYLAEFDLKQKYLSNWLVNKEHNAKDLYQILYDLSTKKLLEILIDRFYKDIAYNFLINLNSIINFFRTIDLSQLSISKEELVLLSNRLERYEKISQFYELTRDEQLNLYNSFDKAKSYTAEFYDDFNMAKEFAYKKYNEVVFDKVRDIHLLNADLSNQLGIPIYELKGDDYFIYSHVTSIKRDESILRESWESTMNEYLDNPFVDEYKKSGLSVSLSSSIKKESFRPVSEYVSFGFCHLLPNRIAHVYHTDSYSAYYNHGIGMDKINEIFLPKDLIVKTCKYNEILYQEISEIILDSDVRTKYEELMPDYLLCYDKIESSDLRLAKKMNLPILVIYTKYYSPDSSLDVRCDRNSEYLTMLSDILKVKTYRKKDDLQL